ncbi:VAMP-associated protein [Hysterangium stoloniferum]|nr:VAMP-associated protein [Hysterangium stoloniferum]
MSVSLSPSTSLGFNRPLTEHIKRTLTITNHNALPVAFKVKTTAPKLYCVRPNAGRIEPGESVLVSVQSQAMKEEPPLNFKCKDKFLVQSMAITPDKEPIPLSEIWNTPGSESKVKIHQQKIKVVYLPAEGYLEEEPEEAQPSRVEESRVYETVREQQSHTNGYTSTMPTFEPPRPTRTATPPPRPRSASPHIDESFVAAREEQSRLEEVRISPSPEPRQPSPVNAVREHELNAKLAEAQEEIQRLRALLAQIPDTGELRRRSGAARSEETLLGDVDAVSEAGTTQTFFERNSSRQDGASPQLVGIIALIVFIITYLFF